MCHGQAWRNAQLGVKHSGVKGKTGIELLKAHAVHIASVVTFCRNLSLNIWIPRSLAFFSDHTGPREQEQGGQGPEGCQVKRLSQAEQRTPARFTAQPSVRRLQQSHADVGAGRCLFLERLLHQSVSQSRAGQSTAHRDQCCWAV